MLMPRLVGAFANRLWDKYHITKIFQFFFFFFFWGGVGGEGVLLFLIIES